MYNRMFMYICNVVYVVHTHIHVYIDIHSYEGTYMFMCTYIQHEGTKGTNEGGKMKITKRVQAQSKSKNAKSKSAQRCALWILQTCARGRRLRGLRVRSSNSRSLVFYLYMY